MSKAAKSTNGAGAPGGTRSPTLRSAHSLPDLSSPRALLSRSLFARQHGYTFDGHRNVDQVLGYATTFSVADYRDRYDRGDISARIVEAYPSATWVPGTEVYELEDPETVTGFEEDMLSIADRLDLWSKILRADILGTGLGRYSVLLLGVAHPSKLDTALPRSSRGASSLVYLTPYGEDSAAIDKLVEDERDARFGLPLTYKIHMGQKSNGTKIEHVVHWTRVVHIAEGLLDNEVYGRPRLRTVWRRLDDLDKVVGGGSEAAWNRMDPGFHVNAPLFGPDGQELEPMDEDEMALEFEERRHGLKRDLYTRGVEVTPLSASVNSFGPNADAILQLISGALGIPKRILVGSERGELSSSQDRENWNARTTERQNKFGYSVLRQLVQRLIDYGYVRSPAPENGWKVWWAEKDELAETEKPSVVAQLASANQAQVAAEGQLILTSAEIREQVYGLEPLPDPEVEDEEETEDVDEDDDGEETPEADPDEPVALRSAVDSFDLADSPADEPEWRSVHRAADAHRDSLARLFLGAWRDTADEMDGTELEVALSVGSLVSVSAMVDAAIREAEVRVMGVLPGRLHGVLVDGALAGLRAARARGGWRSATASSSGLDIPRQSSYHPTAAAEATPGNHPRSNCLAPATAPGEGDFRGGGGQALDIHGAGAGRQAGTPTGPAVSARTAVLPRADTSGPSSFYAPSALPVPLSSPVSEGGILRSARFSASFDATNPRAVAYADTRSAALVTQIGGDTRAALRELVAAGLRDGIPPAKLRQYVAQSVGLRTDQVEAVWRLRGRLAGAKPGSTVRAGKVRIKVPKTGPSSSFIDRHAERYAKKLLNDRALLIARTECLPGEALVDAAVVRAVHRRWYDGYMVEVTTASGRQFSTTPNHPMLTRRGWLGSGELREGDYLVRDDRQQDLSTLGDPDVAARPTAIREIFDAASAVGVVEGATCGEPDFHGDGMDGQVDIAWPFWLLRYGIFSPITKPLEDQIFTEAHESRLTFCDSCHGLLPINQASCLCDTPLANTAFGEAALYEVNRDIEGGGDAVLALSRLIASGNLAGVDVSAEVGRLSPSSEELLARLAQAARRNVGTPENVGDPSRISLDSVGYHPDAQPPVVQFDRVLSVVFRPFSGHVFNLSTPYGYFTSNGGLYTGNTLRSANAGQRELWVQAQETGSLPADARRRWIATPDDRTRIEHADMDGQETGIDQPFDPAIEPGDEVNCRCAMGLV